MPIDKSYAERKMVKRTTTATSEQRLDLVVQQEKVRASRLVGEFEAKPH